MQDLPTSNPEISLEAIRKRRFDVLKNLPSDPPFDTALDLMFAASFKKDTAMLYLQAALKHGRAVSIGEIANESGMSLAEVRHAFDKLEASDRITYGQNASGLRTYRLVSPAESPEAP